MASSLSGTTAKGTTTSAVPYFLFWNGSEIVSYLTGTGAGSSTFASRRNFAASSGGVGLM